MGDNFLRQQVRNFTKRQDRLKEDLKQPRLFETKEIFEDEFKLTMIPGTRLEPGQYLYAVAPVDDSALKVAKGGHQLGTVEDTLALHLRDKLKAGGQTVVELQIISFDEATQTAKARLAQRTNDTTSTVS